MARVKSMKKKKKIQNTIIYIVLVLLSIIWVTPIAWIVYISFSNIDSVAAMTSAPDYLTFQHYINLFTNKNEPYFKWFIS